MGIAIYQTDDTTLATAQAFATTAGVASSIKTFHAWYNKGTAGGSATNVRFQLEVEDPGSPGTYVIAGQTAVDEGHFVARIAGQTNTGDTTQVAHTSQWTVLGGGVTLECPPISGNCARYIEIYYRPPLKDGASTESINWRLVPIYAEVILPEPNALAYVGNGVIPGTGDVSIREWVNAPAATASGPADALVNISTRKWIFDGVVRCKFKETVTLNQTSASGALGVGEEYKALISQGESGAATSTKGNKAAAGASVVPTLPSDQLLVCTVLVSYQGGGTSVINTSDITTDSRCVDGRLKAANSGSGLTLWIGPGRALVHGCMFRSVTRTSLTVTDASTNRIWLNGAAGLTSTTTAAPPSRGAMLIATAVAAGGVITTVTDKRSFLWPPGTARRWMWAAGPLAASASWDYFGLGLESQWTLDLVDATMRVAGTVSGATTFDINRCRAGASATIFTNQAGSPETRPTMAFGTTYTDSETWPELTTFEPGDILVLDVDAVTGTVGEDAAIQLVFVPVPIVTP